MRGHVTKRGKSWAIVIELSPDPETGKRRQRWHSGYRTRKEAERARTKLLSQLDEGTYITPTKENLGEYLDRWLGAIENTIRPSTHYSYSRNVRLHVKPYLGNLQLQRVDASNLNKLYSTLLQSGSKHYRGGGLSNKSVRYVHVILHRAFKDAVRWGLLQRNPTDAADPPKVRASARTHIRTWGAPQVGEFLRSLADDPLHPAFMFLATTGMRRGEALGLRWSDIDFSNLTASVEQTVIAVNHEVQFGSPKTEMGERPVDIDPGTMAALKAHRAAQNRTKLIMGPAWHEHDLVFCRNDGNPLHPERFSRDFDKRVAKSGLPRIRLHDLRHTWATLALRAGVHPKVVQERLGHASISITLGIYSHVAPTMQKEAAAKVAGLMFDA
jgi:integrase